MSFEHTSTYRLRHYECDANGHVNNANYVRYLLETHVRALAAAGQDPGRLAAMNRRWQARELFIEFLRPLTFGDVLTVKAALDDLAEDRAKWTCECRNDGSGELCAQAQMEFEFLDTVTTRPCSLPSELADGLGPAEGRPSPLRRSRFPSLPPRPAGAVTSPWEVQWRDVGPDLLLHTATYLDYLSDFLTKAAAAGGRTIDHDIEEELGWVIRRQWLRIIEPATLGRGLRLSTWISDIKRVTVMRHFTIHAQDNGALRLGSERAAQDEALRHAQDGALIGEAHTLWVCVDPRSGRPARLPESFLQGFAPQISGGQ